MIVGINDYEDGTIPKLKGAVNDATEMCKKLKELGNFDIPPHHFLTDKDATCKAVRKAISDLLWQVDDSCDLALFYFSGHGFVDSRKDGYIAPYDMNQTEPFVCGINMQELKQVVLDSVNKSSVLMILDCCYSGISTKGNVKAPLDPLFGDLDKEAAGKGKFILASSEGDKLSNEISDCTHGNGGGAHSHGIFTYYLLEGLDGKAADETTGMITLERLKNHIETQLKNKGKQMPKFFAGDSNLMSRIQIAVAPQTYNMYIQTIIKEAEDCYFNFQSNKDSSSLIQSVKKIHTILDINANYAKALELKKETNDALTKYQDDSIRWLSFNQDVSYQISNVFPKIEKLVDDLNFDRITTLDRDKTQLLILLCKVSSGVIDNDIFIRYCKPFNNPDSVPKPRIISNIPISSNLRSAPSSAGKDTVVSTREFDTQRS